MVTPALASAGRALGCGDVLTESKVLQTQNRMMEREKLEAPGYPKYATGSPSFSTARLCDIG